MSKQVIPVHADRVEELRIIIADDRLNAFSSRSTLNHVLNLLQHYLETLIRTHPFVKYSVEWPTIRQLQSMSTVWDYWMLSELYEILKSKLDYSGFSLQAIVELEVLDYHARGYLLIELNQLWRFANKGPRRPRNVRRESGGNRLHRVIRDVG